MVCHHRNSKQLESVTLWANTQVQREQFDMIRAQQESIDTLKQMLTQLLEDKRKSTDKTSSKKSKGKRKEGESSSFVHIEEQSIPSRLNPRLKRKATRRIGVFILKE